MTSIGEIRVNDKFQKFIWVACEDCGVERWNLIVRGKARNKVCRTCHAKQSQPHIWENYHRSPIKLGDKARDIIGDLIKRGVITKQPCSLCGRSRGVAHHPDYNQPLRIVWLCQKHHTREHRKYLRG